MTTRDDEREEVDVAAAAAAAAAAADRAARDGERSESVAERIEEIPAPEGADVLEHMPAGQAADVAEALDPNTAAEIISEMDPTLAASVLTDMEAPEAAALLEAMDPDDRVDVLEHVPKEKQAEILREVAAAEAADVRRLQQYPPDTAGGIMTTEVTALAEGLTVGEAIGELRRLSEQNEQLFYVYVVDQRGHLVGVLSMRDLILARPERRLNQIMITGVRAVPATMDQEAVAAFIRRYNYLAVPVVDDHRRLLGIITVDDVVDVMEQEATEDVQRMFGAGPEERLGSHWTFSYRKRTVWLIVNLGTAFLAGWVVSRFDQTINRLTVLAVYMPIVAGMGGNASAQAMAVAIRGLAVGKVDRAAMRHVLVREFLVGILSGVTIGLITAGVACVWQHSPMLGLLVGSALVINHTLACTTGAAIPFVLKRMGFDPAQSASIFATTVTDIAGFFSLLGLAYLFMRWLVQ